MISGSSSELGEIFLLESNILLTNTGLGSGLAPVWFLHIPFQRQTFSAGGLQSPLPSLSRLLSRATENVKTRLRIFTLSLPENKYYGRLPQWFIF